MSDSHQEHHRFDPDAIELLRPEDFGQYLLNSPIEILFVLRALRNTKALITLQFDHGKGLLPSVILTVDADRLILDASSDSEMNDRLVAADKVVCAAMQDKIKIQFALSGLRSVIDEGRPAFAAFLPDTLLRLQRREYYRLTTPMARPIKCIIPFSDAGGEHRTVEANVIDISGGGLAVVAQPEGIHFEAGMEFPNCRVDLPGFGIVVTTLLVRSVFDMTLHNGVVVKRAGCQFVSLPGPMLTRIQRYILRMERERKARESGMA